MTKISYTNYYDDKFFLFIIVKLYKYVRRKIYNWKEHKEIPKQARYFARCLIKRANLSFHTVAKIEDGSTPNPTIDTVKKITDALDFRLMF
jgi:hypothetical protein